MTKGGVLYARYAQNEVNSDITKERDANAQELDTTRMNFKPPSITIANMAKLSLNSNGLKISSFCT